MIRPCFLVVDREHAASISTRKLIIETAKLNVITAYSSAEAVETLQTFPAVHGAVLDGLMKDVPCGELIRRLRELKPDLRIIVVGGQHCGDNVQHVDHFEPQELLAAIKALEPQKVQIIKEHDVELSKES